MSIYQTTFKANYTPLSWILGYKGGIYIACLLHSSLSEICFMNRFTCNSVKCKPEKNKLVDVALYQFIKVKLNIVLHMLGLDKGVAYL